jgi:hypothetical protein
MGIWTLNPRSVAWPFELGIWMQEAFFDFEMGARDGASSGWSLTHVPAVHPQCKVCPMAYAHEDEPLCAA